ncbi:MAG TPA: dTDP-4-amino-4,6-dideoxygalactose transaminase [Lacisediminihabitans sp.]|uniref:dTDP-4-amino-4,6-dideoxygalactose transaminase n=1 Tax=Lacisediminihabitans sp. TaxID=2787631 RepID=UPI002ED77586
MVLPVIPFSRPFRSRNELNNLSAVLDSGHVHGDGRFTVSSTEKLKDITGAERVFLTSSCTHALEMSSLLLDLREGDEVILPSFTFPSAATAVALMGAVPVFVDIDPRSGNIDTSLIERAITRRTRAISVVHYGGVAVELDEVLSIAKDHDLAIIEDNAHGLGGSWKGRSLGTIGTLGTQSFHDTKNVHSGEGGALLVNDRALTERAEIIREKGTDRSRFLRGQVDKYTWVDVGSSYLMSELNAAVLDSQLEQFGTIQEQRHSVWNRYQTELAEWAEASGVRLMQVGEDRSHTAHVFYLVMPDHDAQMALLGSLRDKGVIATFHYIPLDSSPAGLRLGRTPYSCDESLDFALRLVRLPLWAGMPEESVARVIDGVKAFRTLTTGAY